jgi:hypothetical protein
MSALRLHVLPAGHGDCILVEYGDPPARFLIDGGTAGTWQRLHEVLGALPRRERRLELLVVTHVDSDHIAGVLSLFAGGLEGLSFDDIWFNGYKHLVGLEEQGPVQGERLTKLLWPLASRWNSAFGGKAVVVPPSGPLPTKTLPGGMKLTLLSPTPEKLLELRAEWAKVCADEGLDPQVVPPVTPEGLEPMGALDVNGLAAAAFEEDDKPANGSSIAFLAEFGGKSVLFGADAHPKVLEDAIARLPGGRVTVDAFKLPHHGSRNNLSPTLLTRVTSPRFLFSTNGSYFKHPHRETVARILKASAGGCQLRFNYKSAYTSIWNSAPLQRQWRYQASYPARASDGDVIDL